METDKVKLSSLLFGLVIGLLVASVGVVALALAGHLSLGSNQAAPNSDQFVGAAGVANRLPHGYWDTGYGYYVNGVAAVDASRNGSFATLAASATTTLSGQTIIAQATSSTLVLGSASSVACFEGYNAAGTGLVYGTFTSSSFVVSSTKPAACP